MNWILTSMIMFFSSVVYYLFVRKATLQNINYRVSNVANFSIPALLFLSINIAQNRNIFIQPQLLGYIFLSSLLLSYLGSVASYKALSIAPNPGYSLIIQKSYSVYTSILAVYLFDAQFTLLKFIAILIVLSSTAVISLNKSSETKKGSNLWVYLSFASFFLFGTLRLANKAIFSLGVPSTVLLFWTMTFVTSFSLIDYLFSKHKEHVKLKASQIPTLLRVGISVSFFYYYLQVSEFAAPNIGYVNAINSSSNAAYTILAALIFKDALTKKKLFAVFTATIGLIMLIM